MKLTHTGRPGRPRKDINIEWLTDATSKERKITFERIAEVLHMHRHTLRERLREYGIYDRYCSLTNEQLDVVVGAYKSIHPEAGLGYMIGFLRLNGLRIQRKRVGLSLGRVDGLGQVLRTHQTTDRQKYSVPHSNYLWHLDGHHKLIKFGVVIHGIVDGHCHTVRPHYSS